MKKYFIPVGVDLKLLARQLQLQQKQTSHKKIEDRLAYFIGIICRNNLYKQKGDQPLEEDQGWVSLQASYLKKVIGVDYIKYRDLLISSGVIEFNGSYITGSRSMLYRLNPAYIKLAVNTYEILDQKLLAKIMKIESELKDEKDEHLKSLKHLVGVLEKHNLSIDEVGVKNWIAVEDERYRGHYSLVQQNPILAPADKDIIHPDLRRARQLQLADDFLNYRYNYSSDHHFGCRFHSLLTYSPSDFRPFLKHGDEPLVSLDLQNSQPYLLNGVLNADFLCKDKKFSLKRLHPYLYKQLQKMGKNKKEVIDTRGYPDSMAPSVINSASYSQLMPVSIMLQNTPQLLCDQGLQFLNFSGLCQSGLYEKIQELFAGQFLDSSGKDRFATRKSTKLEVMKLFYSDIKSWKTRKDLAPFRKFLELFPAEGNLLLLLKSGHHKEDYKNAPMLLQRVESYLFLKVIAKKLIKKGVPVYTIHDSITVPVSYKEKAKQIMEQELVKHIGIVPTIREEMWVNPRNYYI